jgi:Terminase small subunit
MPESIPTYAANGSRLQSRRLANVLDLERQNRVVLKRSRKGKVLSARFFEGSRAPVRLHWKAGTRYSYQQRSEWMLARLPQMPVPPGLSESELVEELDGQRRKAFQAVPLSIARNTAKVISIKAGEKAERRQAIATVSSTDHNARGGLRGPVLPRSSSKLEMIFENGGSVLSTIKQEIFSRSVAEGHTYTEAARRAGYSAKSACCIGSQLARQPRIAQRVAELRQVQRSRQNAPGVAVVDAAGNTVGYIPVISISGTRV